MVRRFITLGWLLFVAGMLSPAGTARAFPDEPIVIVVHTKPGGAVDLTARMVAAVARRHSPVPMVVENRFGAGGTAAMRAVLDRPADGHTLLAFPATFLSAMHVTNAGVGSDDFRYLICLTDAPECLITRRGGPLPTLADIVRDAEAQPGRQIWLGPGVGSLDHLMAVKSWGALGIEAVWAPYGGGAGAMAALLGGHGDVYVGNPEDVRGRPGLKIVGIAAPARLPELPDVPTLVESGFALTSESMWRGFAVHRDTPDSVAAILTDILEGVAQDPEWLDFVARNAATALAETEKAFTQRVRRDERNALQTLARAGIIQKAGSGRAGVIAAALGLGLAFLALGLVWSRQGRLSGTLALGMLGILVGLWALILGPSRGVGGDALGPAGVPRLWASALLLVGLMQFLSAWRGPRPDAPAGGGPRRPLSVLGLLVGYVVVMSLTGFYTATGGMVAGGMAVLGYRRPLPLVVITAATLIFCHIVFARILGVPLPGGFPG